MNNLMAIAVLVATGAIIYVDNGRRGYDRGKNLFEWFNKKYHYNDFGHWMFEVVFVLTLYSVFPLWLSILIPVIWVFILELFIQGHWSDFWKNHDVFYDFLTHFMGITYAGILL